MRSDEEVPALLVVRYDQLLGVQVHRHGAHLRLTYAQALQRLRVQSLRRHTCGCIKLHQHREQKDSGYQCMYVNYHYHMQTQRYTSIDIYTCGASLSW